MGYNRINYNTTLYNGAPEDFAATAKSIIQAHTGPHIQTVVAGVGLSFVSDFSIAQGITPVPSGFYFPDLAALIRATSRQVDDLSAFIRGFAFLDLPAAVYPVDALPDLLARINALLTTDLGAFILGKLAEAELLARIQGTEFADLIATMLGIEAPNLGATIGAHPPADLGALIWAPENLAARILGLVAENLGGFIQPYSFYSLSGKMLGIPAPNLIAVLKSFQTTAVDLPSNVSIIAAIPELSASIFPTFPSLQASLVAMGQVADLQIIVGVMRAAVLSLAGSISGFDYQSLLAQINVIDQSSINATLNVFGLDKLAEFSAFAQSVNPADLAAVINPLLGLGNLSASIASFTTAVNLGATLVVDETFITSLLTIITLSSANLGAVIGNPACGGGSGIKEISAFANAQAALNLGAFIQSFREYDLGALINSSKSFYAYDTIDITYTRFNTHTPKFRSIDTIDIFYTPFRGATLTAFINPTPPVTDLNAKITSAFPLFRVSPFQSRITAIDLQSNPLDVTDIRLQLEGELTEFLYVQGIDYAFIKDPNQQWRINIRSFKDVAESIFGDREIERICRLGALESFSTLDEAIRFCISAVLGLSSQGQLGATINASGGFRNLQGIIGISDKFSDLPAICSRVFPSDFLTAFINPGGPNSLSGFLNPVVQTNFEIAASIEGFVDENLSASIIAVP